MTSQFVKALALFFAFTCISCRSHQDAVTPVSLRQMSASSALLSDSVQLIYSVPGWLINLHTEPTPVTNRAVRSASRPAVSADSTLVPVLRVDAVRHAAAQVADTSQVRGVVGIPKPTKPLFDSIVCVVLVIFVLGLVIRLLTRMGPQ